MSSALKISTSVSISHRLIKLAESFFLSLIIVSIIPPWKLWNDRVLKLNSAVGSPRSDNGVFFFPHWGSPEKDSVLQHDTKKGACSLSFLLFPFCVTKFNIWAEFQNQPETIFKSYSSWAILASGELNFTEKMFFINPFNRSLLYPNLKAYSVPHAEILSDKEVHNSQQNKLSIRGTAPELLDWIGAEDWFEEHDETRERRVERDPFIS